MPTRREHDRDRGKNNEQRHVQPRLGHGGGEILLHRARLVERHVFVQPSTAWRRDGRTDRGSTCVRATNVIVPEEACVCGT